MGRPPALTPEQRKEAPQRRARGATLQELAHADGEADGACCHRPHIIAYGKQGDQLIP